MGIPELTRSWLPKLRVYLIRGTLTALLSAVLAATLEHTLEARDVATLMAGQTVANVNGARVRYRLLGESHVGVPVVFLSGLQGTIEQADYFQRAVAQTRPALAYDRAGYGFSEGSQAHTAAQQADELAGLLRALDLKPPVVLVAYSLSAMLARVYASRFPQQTAALYLIEPAAPEIDSLIPGRHGPRRRYVRFILHELIWGTLGLTRLQNHLHPKFALDSAVELRAAAVLNRAPHSWALAREWYVAPESARQTIAATLPSSLPVEIAVSAEAHPDETAKLAMQQYEAMVAHSHSGRLHELEHVEHSDLYRPGPIVDLMIGQILELARRAQ
jgi:pimeloyl-ACP methyl ester carboxylesterase